MIIFKDDYNVDKHQELTIHKFKLSGAIEFQIMIQVTHLGKLYKQIITILVENEPFITLASFK